jgi:hypothetical protein
LFTILLDKRFKKCYTIYKIREETNINNTKEDGMKWQNKLNKKELKHIKETTTNSTLAQFKFNREHQKKHTTNGIEACWECRAIAIKLGLEA